MIERNLCALALLAGIAGSVHAQSSVTLYGVADAMLGRLGGPTTGVSVGDRAATVVNGSGLATSHWGIQGSEDLGGGTFAFFDLSSFVRIDSGAAGRGDAIPAPVNLAADPYFSRASYVGLRNSQWGTLRLGNMFTTLFVGGVASNAFANSMTFSPLNLLTFLGTPLTGGSSWADQIAYDSPTFGGARLSLSKSLSESRGGGNLGAQIAYDTGPLALAFAWQDVKKDPLTFADGTSSANTRAWQLAASYDFSSVKVFGHLGRILNRGTEVAPLNINYKLWEVSAAVPVSSGRVLAAAGNRKTGDAVVPQAATASGGNVERQITSLGYVHVLSKRTELYTLLMHDRTATRTLPAPGSLVDARGTSYAVGIRHRF